MTAPMPNFADRLPLPLLLARLPGSDRKRTPSLYSYRITFRNPDDGAVGCVLLWDVSGGRTSYQVALERDEVGSLRLHCTCADAVFRGENEGHLCKHIRGLVEFGVRGDEPSRVASLTPGLCA